MKKIITLSIVCLVSGQLFAQTTEAKAKIEAQKQAQTSPMNLKQATDAGVVPAAAAATVATGSKTAVAPQLSTATTAAPTLKAEAKVADAKTVEPAESVKATADANKATPVAVKKEK